MKLLVLLTFAALASAAPQAQRVAANPNEVQLLRFESDNNGLGSYSYAFEQSDGTKKEEQGELKNAGAEDEFIAVRGSYSWVGPDGITYIINYTADDTGFHPTIEQGPGGSIPAGVITAFSG